jgi:hypothetical protein
MSYRSCPDWPELMEIAPDLQFKHYTVAELKLPADAVVALDATLGELEICADADRHVYFARHTDARVVEALRQSHWFDLTEWTTSGPGSRVSGAASSSHEPPSR